MKVNEQTLNIINRLLKAGSIGKFSMTAVLDKDDPDVININDESGNAGFGIVAVEGTVDSIAGPKKVTKYAVSKLKIFPGTYWEPPDYDMVDVGEYRSLPQAVEKICLMVAEDHVKGSLESESWAIQSEEEREANVSRSRRKG